MSTYIVKRPQGIKVNGEQISAGQTVTSEQIGAKSAIFSMMNMGWIEEQQSALAETLGKRAPSAASTKTGPKPGRRPAG